MAVAQEARIQSVAANKVEHLRLLIGNQKPGGVMCELHLIIAGSQVTGSGCLTQATNPPMNMQTCVTGNCTLIAWGGEMTRCITLMGHEFPMSMPPNPMNMQNMQLLLNMSDPKTNTACYCYLCNGEWRVMADQPVAVQCLPCE